MNSKIFSVTNITNLSYWVLINFVFSILDNIIFNNNQIWSIDTLTSFFLMTVLSFIITCVISPSTFEKMFKTLIWCSVVFSILYFSSDSILTIISNLQITDIFISN